MRRTMIVPLAALLLALLACNAPGSGTPPTITPISDPPPGVTLEATPTAGDPIPTPIPPTAVPPTTSMDPYFSGPMVFTADPNVETNIASFAAATEEVYALWTYHNMRAGLTVRREWYRGGALIINREEPWDFNKDGSDGIVRDIKIYDYSDGLESGAWELRLYIDDRLQVIDGTPNTFSISDTDEAVGFEELSPDGSKTLKLVLPGKLVIRSSAGVETTIVTTDEITEAVWFPDSRLIAYIRPDRSQQQFAPATIGLKTELHFVDSQNGDDWQIGDPNKVYQHPVISPNGVYIALQTGTEYGDAGFFDRGLEVITLTADYQLESTRDLLEFVPGMDDPNLFGNYFPTDLPGLYLPGMWDSNTVLRVAINSTGAPEEATLRGVYLMDAASGVGTKIADLP